MMENLRNIISLFEEMSSYETLWAIHKQTLKSIATTFKETNMLPSELLKKQMKEDLFELANLKKLVECYLSNLKGFSVCVHGAFQYPERLQAARYPIELFYYKGDIGLLESKCVSVVGARACSEDGIKRARKLAQGLVENNYTIVSGLATGIDAAAMTAATEIKGRTIGVIGTPLNKYYPKENKELQDYIAQKFLLISQVPFYRYEQDHFRTRSRYFPQRNETMAALSEATIIVEASEKSGTLTQARACLQQGRKLFILNSCFENRNISWPRTYEKRGAVRIKNFDDIFSALEGCNTND